jgi:hypothetical protein
MLVTVYGFRLSNGDFDLIHKMVQILEPKNEVTINIIDTQCYSTSETPSGDIILIYGGKAERQLQTNAITLPSNSFILRLPELKSLHKGTANKETRQEAMTALQNLRGRIEAGEVGSGVAPKEVAKDPSVILEESKLSNLNCSLKMKRGETLKISNLPSADINIAEMKAFLQLLQKMPYEEVEIEFIKDNGPHDD